MTRTFLTIIALYLLTRFFNLLSLPIFNDEAIYLHWGQIMTGAPNQAFYSLFDGKPPLVLWLLGVFQNLPIDPLIAGRFVPVLFGTLTLVGIIQTAKLLKLSTTAQIIAALLYIFNPLNFFFDRMAILDSPISAVFVWVLYLSLKISQLPITNYQLLNTLFLGFTQGIGLWIKGTSNLFLYLPFTIPLLTLIFNKNLKRAGKEFFYFSISFFIAQLLFLPIRFQSLSQTYFKREGDFLLPLLQAIQPVNWLPRIPHISLTFFVYLSLPVLLLATLGFIKLHKQNSKTSLFLALSLFLPLAFEILTAKYFLSRYFLFTLIPIFLFAGFGLDQLKKFQKPALLLTFAFPLALTLALALSPLKTIQTLSFNSSLKQDMPQYVTGWPSGYGVKEAIDWISQQAKSGPLVVLTRADFGNPEDAMFVYLTKTENIILAQARRKPSQEDLAPLVKFPIYFVSRGEQYLDMKDQLTEIKIFPKPEGQEFVGIYQLKTQ